MWERKSARRVSAVAIDEAPGHWLANIPQSG
jgi:hypothetical protein